VLARTESFNYIKFAGVLISLFGVIFVSKADHGATDDIGNSPILGKKQNHKEIFFFFYLFMFYL